MKLKELLIGVDIIETSTNMDIEIASIAYKAREVKQNSLFVAFSSFGNQFVTIAVNRGACVVVASKKPIIDIPYILVPNERLALALISANFYDHPSKNMVMIGVTGTNGKTSVTTILKQVLEKTVNAKVGLIGTIENLIDKEVVPAERTTPESLELQTLLARMRDAGCTYVVMEVTSHSLALNRVSGIHFDIAAFTNLTEDHLDFHKTMDEYCAAKAMLFERCDKAVINTDDFYSFHMVKKAPHHETLTISLTGNGDLNGAYPEYHAEGVTFEVMEGLDERYEVKLPIPGKFTVYNALSVLGIVKQLDIPMEDAVAALGTIQGVKGRIEVVPTPGKDYSVLIDYAHTPDGLENVLSSVREFCKGRLISVFGCGGDRDPIKRPIMGEIGVRLSDIAIISSDNPRTENPQAIIDDILKGVDASMGEYTVVPERRSAIRYAMDIAKKDDIIVLAGKGHETFQEIHGYRRHLDEREEIQKYLNSR